MPFALMSAELKTAMLYGSGDVKVNGKGAGNSSALYSGDSVRTAAGSTATITSSGTVITLDENSGLSLGTNKVDISQGHAVVNTTKGVVTHFAGVTASPASETAKFAVVRQNGKYEIAALTGPLTISDGKHTALLEAGNIITKSEAQSQEPAPPEPKSKRKTGAFAIPGWEVALLVGGAGAAGYGIWRATQGDHQQNQSPTSPSSHPWQQ